MCIWVYTSEAAAKRIRELYLKAVLRQDVAFFDNVGAGEITTRIQTDTRSWSLFLSLHGSINECRALDLIHQVCRKRLPS
jgi:ABC-type multidrug transport system fused ATPase/permease subunit